MASSLKVSAREHPIKAVTVYKSHRAEVVRTFSLDLQPGNTKIEITELPSCIDTHSVRVSGLGDARLFDVVCTARAPRSHHAPSEAVRVLNAQRLALEGQKRVRDYESDLLVTYARTLTGEHVAPQQMGEFLQSFVEQGRTNLEVVAALDEKIVAVDRQIEREQEKDAARKGAATGEVTIVVGSDAPARVDLKLTYIVSNASWESTYELHAATENGKPSSAVTLHYRARIVQCTGEDWADTVLTLSTVAASTIVKNIPFLSAIKIRPRAAFHSSFNKGASNNSNSNLFAPKPARLVGDPAGSNIQQPVNQNQQWQPFGSQQQQQPQGSSIFGSSQPQSQGAGLFGATQRQGGSHFGATQQQGAGLFGATQQQGGSLFGAPQQQGGSLFGATQQQGGGPPGAPQQPIGFAASSDAPFATGPATGHEQELPSEPQDAASGADEEFEEIAIPGAQSGPTTIVTETPLAVSYAVDGATTVPSDGTAHQVIVAVLPFEAKISHICTPRIDPRVYLQCNVKNTSEYRLLPGPVSVVLNDSFVSKTSINEINTGDTFACTLGDDAGTKVSYARSSKTVTAPSGAFAEALNSTTYATKVTIHNKHPFALTDLVVRDIIPTSDDKRAKVLLHTPPGLADAKEDQVVELTEPGLTVCWGKTADGRPGEKEGRFEWAWSVDAGKAAVLEAEWELKAPADVTWVEFVPFGFAN
ncbi:hypothetical protein GGX14DRAFT_664691 [Mycena pura]|uniref:DUF4139 domain-containing protein n=1 Tax=Mycena pura TaxID=153505 RepID=A0AAD6Y4K6_9AGAR|nr:hypothetical protein GGX14DRAFT_664691 [Mycena pura]